MTYFYHLFLCAVNLGHSPSIRRNQPSEEAKAELKFQKKTEFISVKEKVSVRAGIC